MSIENLEPGDLVCCVNGPCLILNQVYENAIIYKYCFFPPGEPPFVGNHGKFDLTDDEGWQYVLFVIHKGKVFWPPKHLTQKPIIFGSKSVGHFHAK